MNVGDGNVVIVVHYPHFNIGLATLCGLSWMQFMDRIRLDETDPPVDCMTCLVAEARS